MCTVQPCAVDAARITRVQQLSCMSSPPPDFANWRCSGARLFPPGGPECTIQVVPAGSIIYTVSCGACVTLVGLQ
jgi:hypothetical protein